MGGATPSGIAILVAFVVLTASATAKASDDCSSIFSCSIFLQDPNLTPPPGSSCCNSARQLLADFVDDVESLCQCLSPFVSRFLPHKAQQISSLCNIPSFSDIVPCVAASAPQSAVVPDSFLPPFFPLPPVFTFPPFFPLPPFLPFTPPAPAPPPAEV